MKSETWLIKTANQDKGRHYQEPITIIIVKTGRARKREWPSRNWFVNWLVEKEVRARFPDQSQNEVKQNQSNLGLLSTFFEKLFNKRTLNSLSYYKQNPRSYRVQIFTKLCLTLTPILISNTSAHFWIQYIFILTALLRSPQEDSI